MQRTFFEHVVKPLLNTCLNGVPPPNSHLTTCHSNTGVQIIAVFDLGTSTLAPIEWFSNLYRRMMNGREGWEHLQDQHFEMVKVNNAKSIQGQRLHFHCSTGKFFDSALLLPHIFKKVKKFAMSSPTSVVIFPPLSHLINLLNLLLSNVSGP